MDPSDPWKIVLIDDEADIREVISITLKDAGYQVTTASDGRSGLRLCEEKKPQIVITDIRMPGMDGLHVLERLKKTSPDIEVIVATAFGEMDVAIRALQLDASDFVTKPVNDESLHLALTRAKQRYTAKKQVKDYTALLESEKAETAQELIKTIAFQKNLIEGSMDGIMGCDPMGRVLTFNRSMAQILDLTKDQVVNKMSLTDFFLPEEEKRFQQALANEKYGGIDRLPLFETTLLNGNGHKIPVQISATVLFENGAKSGLVCFVKDLSEMRRLEREVADQARILHQDKMMSLGRLAASVVHEVNNPLSGILNYVRLMIRILQRGPMDEKRREKFQTYLDLVEKETDRCSQIISSLLTFSRKSPVEFSPVDIHELINRSILLSQHKLVLGHIRIQVDVDEDMPPVMGDFNQLQQCIINLIFNALDAMPEGGELQVKGEYPVDGKAVLISVRDNGIGFSKEDGKYLFEPFFTTKKEGYGVGLGLSTVYGILERHKGTIQAKSRPGDGTTFTMRLPVLGSDITKEAEI
jgi:PAS domain S-box-containing protein